MRVGLVGLLAAGFAVAGTPALAQVRDAVYRGTIVCDKLPFTVGSGREAIEVTITGGAAQYTHVVRLHGAADPTPERGAGTLSGSTISLQGSWKSGNRQYEAKYSGTFVRRHANLNGAQERWGQIHQPYLFRDNQAAIAGIFAPAEKIAASRR